MLVETKQDALGALGKIVEFISDHDKLRASELISSLRDWIGSQPGEEDQKTETTETTEKIPD